MLNCRVEGSNTQGSVGWVLQKNILKSGSHNKMTLREYGDYTIKWQGGGQLIKKWGEGSMIFVFLLFCFYINSGTDVFYIRKNVQK